MENENRLVNAKEVEEIFNYEVSVAEKDPLDAFDSAILNAATVDAVEVVHAHWLPDDEYDICSHCQNPIVLDRLRQDSFCKNCGAKMDGDAYDSAASG